MTTIAQIHFAPDDNIAGVDRNEPDGEPEPEPQHLNQKQTLQEWTEMKHKANQNHIAHA
jgi:hypothetical protein